MKHGHEVEDLNDVFKKEPDVSEGRHLKYVELLKFKTLSVGMKLWGAVAEVGPQDLIVSLPHGLRGFVAPREASDELFDKLQSAGDFSGSDSDDNEDAPMKKAATSGMGIASQAGALRDTFRVGQLVRCVVLHLGSKTKGPGSRIDLSLRLTKLQHGQELGSLRVGVTVPACIRSVEDHGYVLNFGVSGISGFLLNADAEAAVKLSGRSVLVPGTFLDCTVSKVDKKKKVVSVTTLAKPAPSQETDGLSLGNLTPGMLVAAKITHVLPDGLIVNFLSYFTGTVDWFHLEEELPTRDWAKAYAAKQRVSARILYVDVVRKRVGLTLKPSLVHAGDLKPGLALGTVVEEAVVYRIDPGVGMLLQANGPATSKHGQSSSAAYVHISDASDERMEKLEKVFKPGQKVQARVIGSRLLDGMNSVSLKTSVVEQEVFTYEDVTPGRVVKGTIVAVEEYGLLIALSDTIKALCPITHLSDVPRSRVSSRFAVGNRIKVRILERDAARRRVTVTHKRTLLTSKLPTLVSTHGTPVGTVAHGYVTGIEKWGVFVCFYGGCKGLARLADLGLAPDQSPLDAFEMHQVVKVKVLGSEAGKHERLQLSLDPGSLSGRASESEENERADGNLSVGQVVSGKVGSSLPAAGATTLDVLVTALDGQEGHTKFTRALLEVPHLSDHPGAALALLETLQPGSPLGKLVVLEERSGGGARWRVSRKASLVEAADTAAAPRLRLPRELSDLHPGSTYPGYVASVTAAGCFVRFLGRLTGLAPTPQLADTFVTDPKQHYAVGQSVRAQVLEVDAERQRCLFCLKPSQCGGGEAQLLQTFLRDMETVHAIAASRSSAVVPEWETSLSVGGLVEGTVHEKKEYGVLVNLQANADVVGFVALHQIGNAAVEPGSKVKARVMDVSKKEGIVDLSLLTDMVATKKKSKDKPVVLEIDQTLIVRVELVKEDYLVVSLPEKARCVAVIGTKQFNLRTVDVRSRFQPAQTLKAVVKCLACPETGGRVVLALKEGGDGALKRRKADAGVEQAVDESRTKRRRPSAAELIGSKVSGTVSNVKALHASVKLENGWRGRVHITEAGLPSGKGGMAAKFEHGAHVQATVLDVAYAPDGSDTGALELTMLPSSSKRLTLESAQLGESVSGYIQQVGVDFLWVALTPTLRGRVFLLDASEDVEVLRKFTHSFSHAQHLERCTVIGRDLHRRTLDLSLKPALVLEVGCVVVGRVCKLLPGVGMNVQLGVGRFGRVHITDVHDAWVEDPLKGFIEGQLVTCCVVEAKCENRLDLSLRTSRGGCEGHAKPTEVGEVVPEVPNAAALSTGQAVWGYVKHTSSRGCFVTLGRAVDAYVRLGNLSESFVSNPGEQFPPGKLVRCRVIDADAGTGRVEATLKMSATVVSKEGARAAAEEARTLAMSELDVGSVVWGKVKRHETFGMFIELEGQARLTGMCHVSELADEYVRKPESLFSVGDRVKARVIRLDAEKGKLYLGLKPSYFVDEAEQDEHRQDGHTVLESSASGEDEAEKDESEAEVESDAEDSDSEQEGSVEVPVASRVTKPKPLNVEAAMDWDGDGDDALNVVSSVACGTTATADVDSVEHKNSKREKKRLKQAREAEVAAQERARLLGEGAPNSVEEFERAVLTAQSSSFVWIKFIAWHVSRSEVAEARKIAERALEAIHFREDAERFNVWMAFLNLENMYGEPSPKEAVAKLFLRAVQATNAKKLHLGVVGMYERTDQNEEAEQLLKLSTRKFSMSAKVWLRHIQHLLHLGKGDAAKAVMDRSLQSLPRRKHIKVISQTALLEFKIGDPERGRSVFEGILRNYPKRVDLWSVFLDQEVKLGGSPERARALFQRVVCLSLPPRKMKTIFKKYLEFEKQHGDLEHMEHVKQQATDYAEQNL